MDLLDTYGDQMFGRRIRLRVLLWAEEQRQEFNQSQAARGVDYSATGEVAKELERLVGLGMLRKFGRPSHVGPQNYVRVEHPGWAIAVAARAAVKALSRKDKEQEPGTPPDPPPAVGGGSASGAPKVQHLRRTTTE